MNLTLTTSTGSKLTLPPGRPTDKDRKEAGDLINKLHYKDIFKNPGTIFTSKLVRLDAQPSTSGKNANLQVQINGIKRPSTIAGTLVDEKLRDYGATQQQPERDLIEKTVRDALHASLRDGTNRSVNKK